MKTFIEDKKLINWLVIVFTALFVYMIVADYDPIIYSIEEFRESPIDSLAFLFPFFLLPFGIFFFWKRKNIGWILLAVFLCYTSTTFIIELARLVARNYNSEDEDMMMMSDVLPVVHIIALVLMLIGLYLVGGPRIRNIYKISLVTMFITVFASIGIGVLLFFLYDYS